MYKLEIVLLFIFCGFDTDPGGLHQPFTKWTSSDWSNSVSSRGQGQADSPQTSRMFQQVVHFYMLFLCHHQSLPPLPWSWYFPLTHWLAAAHSPWEQPPPGGVGAASSDPYSWSLLLSRVSPCGRRLSVLSHKLRNLLCFSAVCIQVVTHDRNCNIPISEIAKIRE